MKLSIFEGFKTIFRFSIRLFLFSGVLITLPILSLGVHAIAASSEEARKKKIMITAGYCKFVLSALGIKVTVNNEDRLKQFDLPPLTISNHLGYLDILAISSFYPTAFVTSAEMHETPILGTICRAGGSLFVERRKIFNLRKEIAEIARVLEAGIPITVFPEGTSSNGDDVMPFRGALLKTALQARRGIVPICIRYRKVNGGSIDLKNRDILYWYGDMDFAPHFLKLMLIDSAEIEVNVLNPISYEEELHRKNLSRSIENAVREAYLA